LRGAILLVAASAVASVVAAGTSAARTALPRCLTKVPFSAAQLKQASLTIRALFPSAPTVDFRHSVYHGPQHRRQPYTPGWCGSWWVEYRDLIGAGGYVDVTITLFRTPAQALASLHEAAYGSPKVLANGATVRVASDGGGIESVIRNVAIGTVSSLLYVNGVGEVHTRPAGFSESVQMRIHRRIQEAVSATGRR
jgi:hypothetical protein